MDLTFSGPFYIFIYGVQMISKGLDMGFLTFSMHVIHISLPPIQRVYKGGQCILFEILHVEITCKGGHWWSHGCPHVFADNE